MPRKDIKLNGASHVLLRRANKEKAVSYKGGKCSRCEGVFPPFVYDFHHVDPKTKEYSLNWLLDKRWSTIAAELDKCILLCTNCHRIEHWEPFRNATKENGDE